MANDKLLDIEIVTPQNTVFSGKIQSVTLPGSVAPFQVLYNHAPIVTSLDLGYIKIVDESSNIIKYASTEGFAEVRKNVISILVESAFNSKDINLKDTEENIKKLKDKLNNSRDEDTELLINAIKIEENKLRIAKMD